MSALPAAADSPTSTRPRLRAVNVELTEHAGLYTGELHLTLDGGTEVVRRVSAPRCDEVTDALEFVTALATGLDFTPSPPTSPPVPIMPPALPATRAGVEPPVSRGPVDSAVPPTVLPSASLASASRAAPAPAAPAVGPQAKTPAAPPSGPRWRFIGSVQAALLYDVGRSLELAPLLSVGAVYDTPALLAPEIDLAGVSATSGSFDVTTGNSRTATLTFQEAVLSGCPIRVSLGHGFGLRPCVELQVGELGVSNASAPGLVGATTTEQPWVAVAALGRVEWKFLSFLMIQAGGGVEAPLVPDKFYFTNGGTIFNVPGGAGTVRLGASALWP